MVLRIITALILVTSSITLCMETDYNSDEEVKINECISVEDNEKLLDKAINLPSAPPKEQEAIKQCKAFFEQHYHFLKTNTESTIQELKKVPSATTLEAAEKFKQSTTAKYLSKAKNPSLSSFDSLKIATNGMENDGQ